MDGQQTITSPYFYSMLDLWNYLEALLDLVGEADPCPRVCRQVHHGQALGQRVLRGRAERRVLPRTERPAAVRDVVGDRDDLHQ